MVLRNSFGVIMKSGIKGNSSSAAMRSYIPTNIYFIFCRRYIYSCIVYQYSCLYQMRGSCSGCMLYLSIWVLFVHYSFD